MIRYAWGEENMVRGYHPMTDKYTQTCKTNGGKRAEDFEKTIKKTITLKYSILWTGRL